MNTIHGAGSLTADDREWIEAHMSLTRPLPGLDTVGIRREYLGCGHQVGGPYDNVVVRNCAECLQWLTGVANRLALVDGGWVRLSPAIGQGGDCGGDVQISDAYTARWAKLLHGGMVALVTRSLYVVEVTDSFAGYVYERFGVTVDADNQYIECQTEYLVCTDLNDPGGTEVASEYLHEPLAAISDLDPPLTDAGAYLAAERIAGPTDDEWLAAGVNW